MTATLRPVTAMLVVWCGFVFTLNAVAADPDPRACTGANSRISSVLKSVIDPLIDSHTNRRFSKEGITDVRLAAIRQTAELASNCAVAAITTTPTHSQRKPMLYEASFKLNVMRANLAAMRIPECDHECLDVLMGIVKRERTQLAQMLSL